MENGKDVTVCLLRATIGENDVELNGETDDEEMEDGEVGFDDGSAQVRNIPDPDQPTVKEHQEHTSSVQIMMQVLRDGTRGERTAQEIRHSRGLGRSPARVDGLWVSFRSGNLKSNCLLCWSSANGVSLDRTESGEVH